MPRVSRTRAAEEDLFGIWEYISRDNPAAADGMLRHIDQACEMLANNPEAGRLRLDLRLTGIRSFPVPPYVLFYRPTEEGIELYRVLHGARDGAGREL